jgi:murein L,D-transpeptidase YafK
MPRQLTIYGLFRRVAFAVCLGAWLLLIAWQKAQAQAQDPESFLPDAIIQPGNKPGYILVVFKATQELRIYNHDGQGNVWLEKVLPCSTGMLQGDKLIRGDKKTPEGYYLFRQKLLPAELPDIYGILAFPMDYPNFWDKSIGRGGDGIWTHGVNKPLVDYDSNGCIELLNHDLAALEPYIKLYETPILVYETPNFLAVDELKKQAEEISAFVESWRAAWVSKNHNEYANKYDKEFFNSEGLSYQGWMDRKRRIAQGYKNIEITLTDIRIFRHRNVIMVGFTQNYNGDNRFKSVGTKRLYLNETDSGYLIAGEEYGSLPGPQPEKWLTAEERNVALTTPPLAVAQLSEPLASAAAGALLPSEPIEVASAQTIPPQNIDEDQAAADETARAALEVRSLGLRPSANAPQFDDQNQSQEQEVMQGQPNNPAEIIAPAEINEPNEPIMVADLEPQKSSQQTDLVKDVQPVLEAQSSSESADGAVALLSAEEPQIALASFEDDPAPQEAQASVPSAQQAQDLIAGWLAAWSNRDQEKYFAYYAPDFYFPDLNLHLQSFKRYRGKFMSQAASIKVEAHDLKITVSGSKAKVTFEQSYKSDRTSDMGLKTLELVAVNGQWKISSETFKALP